MPSSVDNIFYSYYLTSSLRFSSTLTSPGTLEMFSGNGEVLFNFVIFALDGIQRKRYNQLFQVVLYVDLKEASLYKIRGAVMASHTKLAFL